MMSAETTDLGMRLLWTAAILVALVLIYLAMWRSWRRAPQYTSPLDKTPPQWQSDICVSAVYASTTRAGRWMERLRGGDLGSRSQATLCVGGLGIWIERESAQSIFIGRDQIQSISLAPGIAGKVVGGRGVLVVTWTLGDHLVDTGLLITDQKDRETIFTAASELVDV
jgi:hypothetical protein